MGKKRRTRWRRLSLGEASASGNEEDEDDQGCSAVVCCGGEEGDCSSNPQVLGWRCSHVAAAEYSRRPPHAKRSISHQDDSTASGSGPRSLSPDQAPSRSPDYPSQSRCTSMGGHTAWHNGTCAARNNPSGPNGGTGGPPRRGPRYGNPHGYSNGGRHFPSTNGVEKKIFNDEEYTKISTPRQEVLFKKGSIGKKKVPTSTTPVPNGTTPGIDNEDVANGNCMTTSTSSTTSENEKHVQNGMETGSNADTTSTVGDPSSPDPAAYENSPFVCYPAMPYDFYGNGYGMYPGGVLLHQPYPGGPLLAAVPIPVPVQPVDWYNRPAGEMGYYYTLAYQPAEPVPAEMETGRRDSVGSSQACSSQEMTSDVSASSASESCSSNSSQGPSSPPGDLVSPAISVDNSSSPSPPNSADVLMTSSAPPPCAETRHYEPPHQPPNFVYHVISPPVYAVPGHSSPVTASTSPPHEASGNGDAISPSESSPTWSRRKKRKKRKRVRSNNDRVTEDGHNDPQCSSLQTNVCESSSSSGETKIEEGEQSNFVSESVCRETRRELSQNSSVSADSLNEEEENSGGEQLVSSNSADAAAAADAGSSRQAHLNSIERDSLDIDEECSASSSSSCSLLETSITSSVGEAEGCAELKNDVADGISAASEQPEKPAEDATCEGLTSDSPKEGDEVRTGREEQAEAEDGEKERAELALEGDLHRSVPKNLCKTVILEEAEEVEVENDAYVDSSAEAASINPHVPQAPTSHPTNCDVSEACETNAATDGRPITAAVTKWLESATEIAFLTSDQLQPTPSMSDEEDDDDFEIILAEETLEPEASADPELATGSKNEKPNPCTAPSNRLVDSLTTSLSFPDGPQLRVGFESPSSSPFLNSAEALDPSAEDMLDEPYVEDISLCDPSKFALYYQLGVALDDDDMQENGSQASSASSSASSSKSQQVLDKISALLQDEEEEVVHYSVTDTAAPTTTANGQVLGDSGIHSEESGDEISQVQSLSLAPANGDSGPKELSLTPEALLLAPTLEDTIEKDAGPSVMVRTPSQLLKLAADASAKVPAKSKSKHSGDTWKRHSWKRISQAFKDKEKEKDKEDEPKVRKLKPPQQPACCSVQ